MTHKQIWLSIGVLAVVVVLVVGTRKKGAELPPPDATLAGPQEPIPEAAYDAKPPLSNHRTFTKNSMNIEVTKEGTGPAITSGQTAVVTYIGKLENGTVFDASKNHGDGTFAFALGAGQVIKGWDQGVEGMKIGETRILTIPSDMAYGPTGIPGVIPGGATLIFEVSLLGIK